MAQIDARPIRSNPRGKFQRFGARLDNFLTPTRVAYLFVCVSLFIVATGFILRRRYPDGIPLASDWIGDLWQQVYSNLGIEVLSIAVTVIVIERLNRRQAERELKEDLIFQMGSRVNAVAVEAVRRLSQKRWGIEADRSLQRAHFPHANLQGANLGKINLQAADLSEANLQGVDLRLANLRRALLTDAALQGADLTGANLRRADLTSANLQNADMTQANVPYAKFNKANLQGASLWQANLQSAELWYANLQDVNLTGASLQGAVLKFANLQNASGIRTATFDESTILPDGSHWTAERDLRQFTDPDGWKAGRYQSS